MLKHAEQRPTCLLSVDLESWFHARLARVSPQRHGAMPGALEGPVGRLLDMMESSGARATFFVLGSVARTHPHLIRRIAARHEVASHGETHRDLGGLDRSELARELESSRARLQDLSDQPVVGFRAPNWSMAGCETRVFPLLLEHGFRYDSSLVPGPGVLFVRGSRRMPREPHRHPDYPELWEFPPTIVRLPGISFPLGGAFLRLLPGGLVRTLLDRARRRGAVPSLHLHPWELPGALPPGLDPLRSILLSAGSSSLLEKLKGILGSFRVVAIDEHRRRLDVDAAPAGTPLIATGPA